MKVSRQRLCEMVCEDISTEQLELMLKRGLTVDVMYDSYEDSCNVIKELRDAVDVYGPDYMHGLPKKHFVRIAKRHLGDA